MYTGLATRLALSPIDFSSWFVDVTQPPAFVFRHSQPVSMDGFNAALFDATVYHFDKGAGPGTEGNVFIDLQGSNDLENWETIADAAMGGNGIQITNEGYFTTSLEPDISFAYLRLQYRVWQSSSSFAGGPSSCVLSAGIELVDE